MDPIRIRDFGKLALNTDIEDTLLQPGEWSVLDNIDIESGDIRSAWGDTQVTDVPPVTPTYMYVFEGVTDTWLVISDGESVYAYNGVSWRDITPSSTAVTDTLWSTATADIGNWEDATISWGEAQTGGTDVTVDGDVFFTNFQGILIVSSTLGEPTYWPSEGSSRLEPLPGWGTGWVGAPVVAYGSHLFCIGLNDGSTAGSKYRVVWSDAAVEGEVPQEWETAADNLAGSVQLRDTDGYLVNAKILRNDLLIFKNDSIYRCIATAATVGGVPLVFQFERVISDHGCDSPWGMDTIGNGCYFVDRGDLRIFDGQVTQSLTVLRVKENLALTVSNEYRDRTYVVAFPEREQLWIGIVKAGETQISSVLLYDLVHNGWTTKRYSALAMTRGPFSATSETPSGGDTWATVTGTWATIEEVWGEGAIEPSEDTIVFGNATLICRADKTNTDHLGQPKPCVAERTGFLIAGLNQRVTMKAVYPEMEGGPVQVQIGYQWVPGGAVAYAPAKTFTPGVDRKLVCRVTGIPCAIRITSQQSKGWRLGGMSFEAVLAGRR